MRTFVIKVQSGAYKVSCSENNTNIQYSYRCTSISEMRSILKQCRSKNNMSHKAILKRSILGMVTEWRSHNLLYSLGIYRDHTESVDLEYPQKWYYKIAYFVLAGLYWRY